MNSVYYTPSPIHHSDLSNLKFPRLTFFFVKSFFIGSIYRSNACLHNAAFAVYVISSAQAHCRFSLLLLPIRRNFGRKSQWKLNKTVCPRTKKRSSTAELRSAFRKNHKATYHYLCLFINSFEDHIYKQKNIFCKEKHCATATLFFFAKKTDI